MKELEIKLRSTNPETWKKINTKLEESFFDQPLEEKTNAQLYQAGTSLEIRNLFLFEKVPVHCTKLILKMLEAEKMCDFVRLWRKLFKQAMKP